MTFPNRYQNTYQAYRRENHPSTSQQSAVHNHSMEPQRDCKVIEVEGVKCIVEQITTFHATKDANLPLPTCLHTLKVQITPAPNAELTTAFTHAVDKRIKADERVSYALFSYQSPLKRHLENPYSPYESLTKSYSPVSVLRDGLSSLSTSEQSQANGEMDF